MIKGDCVYKWIDLSKLPKSKSGHKIKWEKSTGCILNFIYGKHYGTIKILDIISKNKYKTLINTKEKSFEYILDSNSIRNCRLGNAFIEPIELTHPDLLEYFVNKKDANNHSEYSIAEVEMCCPFCKTKRFMRISTLTINGFSCPMCSDGISFPNKFMYNILNQFGVEFINEVTKKNKGFEWVGNYRYDFYVKLKNISFFIEMDGNFHNGSKYCSFEDSFAIDKEKDRIAKNNGINVIRIDCKYNHIGSRFEYVKENIVNSELHDFFDFSLINWDLANKMSNNSNVCLAAEYWNSGILCSKDIGKLLGVCKDTAKGYLQIASKLNMCNYNENELNKRMKKKIENNNKNKRKPIELIKDDNVVGVFAGITELDNRSFELYGTHIDYRNAYAVLSGSRQHTKGYNMKYISKEEYNKYKQDKKIPVY